MAKRYTRINWQNRPSVATPINATNLNKMDKGINDIDNAIEEIYNKRVNNVVTTNPDTFLAGPVGKTLQDQITTINNNLALRTLDIGTVSVDDIFSKISSVSTPGGTSFTGRLTIIGDGSFGLTGYIYTVAGQIYGSVTRTHFTYKRIDIAQINDSVMSDWVTIITWA